MFKVMGFVEQVRTCGFWKVHTFELNIRLIRLFCLMLNSAKTSIVHGMGQVAGFFFFFSFILFYFFF